LIYNLKHVFVYLTHHDNSISFSHPTQKVYCPFWTTLYLIFDVNKKSINN